MSAQDSGLRTQPLSAFGDGGACEIDHRTSELICSRASLFGECPVMALAELLSSFTTSALNSRD
jgi:hypothetical protein